MKGKHIISILTLLLAAACAKETFPGEWLGRGVNFRAVVASPFETRATYRHDGSFNEGDLMTIYRQYMGENGFEAGKEAYRVYTLNTKYAAGTSLVLDSDWKPSPGALGSNLPGSTFVQTSADSLTWENGRTVRFRSFSRSNLAGAIGNSATNKGSYYPDYSISDWVTVSGPTIDVPMRLKHQGCRIGFIAKSGNEFGSAVICLEDEDYDADGQADAVKAVYDRMCMPSGVDIQHSLLRAMTQDTYNGTTDFGTIHEKTEGMVYFGTRTPEEIASDVQRPVFCSNDGRLYMVTIPYDMSSSETGGELLTLPPFTRFRIQLYDVNSGDNGGDDHVESSFHIFSLSDILAPGSTEPLYPNGLELIPGYSYLFSVGYHYNHFTITPADHFLWDEQDAENGKRDDGSHAPQASNPYHWWQQAIHDAIPKRIQDVYQPEFHINTPVQFVELMHLVNGTAARKMSGLTQVLDHSDNLYRWYRSEDVENGEARAGADSVSRAQAEEEGYIFYDHYHPANADQAAYARLDYLRGPFSFYEEDLGRHFTIVLDEDLDFYDWELTSIGASASTPFRGVLEGNVHWLHNVNVEGGYFFGDCVEAAVRNLRIETVHDFKLMRSAKASGKTGYGAYIVGVSIEAPSAGNPIAGSLKGNSYVVGCFYQGRATGALVGEADDLHMIGNMIAADGIPSGSGALLGAYATGATAFLAPQTGAKPTWGRFLVNYYDITLAPGTTAVGGVADAYGPKEYIRGAHSYVLKAKNDNLLSDDVPFDKLGTPEMKEGFYGLAPWKAMNYAIWRYNQDGAVVAEPHNCLGHYVNDPEGYAHSYPVLVPGAPDASSEAWNVLEQNN